MDQLAHSTSKNPLIHYPGSGPRCYPSGAWGVMPRNRVTNGDTEVKKLGLKFFYIIFNLNLVDLIYSSKIFIISK
jgi:hypothetical protein